MTPEFFSIYGLITRTTNAIESSHADLARKMGVHPEPYDFLRNQIFTYKKHLIFI